MKKVRRRKPKPTGSVYDGIIVTSGPTVPLRCPKLTPRLLSKACDRMQRSYGTVATTDQRGRVLARWAEVSRAIMREPSPFEGLFESLRRNACRWLAWGHWPKEPRR